MDRANSMETMQDQKQINILQIMIQHVHAAIDLNYVQKALLLVALEYVPQSPKYLIGLMNDSGRSIPVVDLSLLLGMMRNKPYTLDTPILICKDDHQTIGFIVDNILDISTIQTDELQLLDTFHHQTNTANKIIRHNMPFSAVVKDEQHLSLLLDIKYLLSLDFISSGNEYRLAADYLTEEDHL